MNPMLPGFFDGATWFVAPLVDGADRGAPFIGGRAQTGSGIPTGATLREATTHVDPGVIAALHGAGFKSRKRLVLPAVFERVDPFVSTAFAAMMALPLDPALMKRYGLYPMTASPGWWVSGAGAVMPALCLERGSEHSHVVGLARTESGFRIVRRITTAQAVTADSVAFRSLLESVTIGKLRADLAAGDRKVNVESHRLASVDSPIPPFVRAAWIGGAGGLSDADTVRVGGDIINVGEARHYAEAVGLIVAAFRQFQIGIDREGETYVAKATGQGAFLRAAETTFMPLRRALVARFHVIYDDEALAREVESALRKFAAQGISTMKEPAGTPPHIGHVLAGGTENAEVMIPVEQVYREALRLLTDWPEKRPFDGILFGQWGRGFTALETFKVPNPEAYADLARPYLSMADDKN